MGYALPLLSLLLVTWAVPSTARAENVVFPTNSFVHDVKKEFGARGDGITDDTAALQAAIKQRDGVLYFPNGVYRISGSVVAASYGLGPWIYGQSRDGVVIKLDDGATGFGNPQTPVAVLAAIDLPPNSGLSADHFFRQWHNFTVDTGKNPGAIGVRYFSNNSGVLDNVHIRGNGTIGLDLGWVEQNGPCLIRGVEIEGFDVGVSTSHGLNSQTFSGLFLHDLRSVGFEARDQNLSVEGLRVERTPLPVRTNSMLALIGANLSGGNGSGPAIEYLGLPLYARNVVTRGFSSALSGAGKSVAGPSLTEFVADGPDHLFDSTLPGSLGLPVRAAPEPVWESDPSQWVCVNQFGAVAGDNQDDSAAFQAAIDSAARAGKTTVCIEPKPGGDPNWYDLASSVHVHGSVRHIIGLGFGRVLGSQTAGFVLDKDAAPVVKFENIYYFGRDSRLLRNNDTSTLLVEDSDGFNLDLVGKGDTFIENAVVVLRVGNPAAHVWARQLNTEGSTLDSDNQGGALWVLGLKTEGGGTKIRTSAGGLSELLGAHIYNTCASPTTPLFQVTDAAATFAAVRETVFCAGTEYKTHVQETRGSESRNWLQPSRAWSLFIAAPASTRVCGDGGVDCADGGTADGGTADGGSSNGAPDAGSPKAPPPVGQPPSSPVEVSSSGCSCSQGSPRYSPGPLWILLAALVGAAQRKGTRR